MKLKLKRLSLDERIMEFDDWVTPSIGDIKDTEKFTSERSSIELALQTLGSKTNNFAKLDDMRPERLAESIIEHLTGKSPEDQINLLRGVFSLFFLVTGKSDNNCKCQFPIFLRDNLRVDGFLRVVKSNGESKLLKAEIPRILDDEFLSKHICALAIFPEFQLLLLSQYVCFLLDDPAYLKSFWAVGNTFFRMKGLGLNDEFLMPLVVYRVRGSVSASGGHEPEKMLRDRMEEWGLLPEIDFNTSDVVVGEQREKKKTKTRAYDFVLPFNVAGWEKRIFIQCQFYAGDSGSVSHKNVDQTRASRTFTLSKFKQAQFVEYLDGAGYFGSLNGDLRSILSMKDTREFFQVRTSVVKLRAILQEIGFLTPLEIIHAWSLSNGNEQQTRLLLRTEGYEEKEISRVFLECSSRGILKISNDKAEVSEKSMEIARRYLLLDFIARIGKSFAKPRTKGTIIVPGFGTNFGVSLSDVADSIIPRSGIFGLSWAKNGLILKDIEFLVQQGWIIQQ
ncbi:MAG TPA: hypothetical protein DET40_15555 [Lentisphaeria bacterium]|nr:MAG: hypothetical protein A2X45_04790 [Lentisphaerae bacterium GWF2_50_93]HCE44955.1 hypothetical protein [Lentisphaeria bacterium]